MLLFALISWLLSLSCVTACSLLQEDINLECLKLMIAYVPLPVAVVHLTVRVARMPLPHRIIITLDYLQFVQLYLSYVYSRTVIKSKFVLIFAVWYRINCILRFMLDFLLLTATVNLICAWVLIDKLLLMIRIWLVFLCFINVILKYAHDIHNGPI